MPTQSQINDEELDQMIANLQGQKAGGSNSASAPAPSAQPTQGVQTTQPNLANTIPPSMAGTPRPVNLSGPASQPQPQSQPSEVSQPTVVNQPVQNQVQRPTTVSNLDSIKSLAISELRPLVDKLNVSPEDKFDTILLLIRTTDDSSLIPMAYETARAIADDTRRAQALLDVIKEVDYFKSKWVDLFFKENRLT